MPLIQSPMDSSHGQRSSSVSGWPLCIFATLASEWNASPSANSQPITVEMPLATVLLPLPLTPMTMTTSGCGGEADDGSSTKSGIYGTYSR